MKFPEVTLAARLVPRDRSWYVDVLMDAGFGYYHAEGPGTPPKVADALESWRSRPMGLSLQILVPQVLAHLRRRGVSSRLARAALEFQPGDGSKAIALGTLVGRVLQRWHVAAPTDATVHRVPRAVDGLRELDATAAGLVAGVEAAAVARLAAPEIAAPLLTAAQDAVVRRDPGFLAPYLALLLGVSAGGFRRGSAYAELLERLAANATRAAQAGLDSAIREVLSEAGKTTAKPHCKSARG